jgi:hypothetical protein
MCRAKMCRAADFHSLPAGTYFSSDRHIFSSGRAKLNRRFLSQKCAGQFSPRPDSVDGNKPRLLVDDTR